jgi:hypothetical protein
MSGHTIKPKSRALHEAARKLTDDIRARHNNSA